MAMKRYVMHYSELEWIHKIHAIWNRFLCLLNLIIFDQYHRIHMNSLYCGQRLHILPFREQIFRLIVVYLLLTFIASNRWGQVTHTCVSKLCNHWFRKWLVAWLVRSHYLTQCRNVVNRTLRNKPQWNFGRNSYILIQQNAFENVVSKMVVILSRHQCVNGARMIV